jgi:hypothetical protein
VPVTPETAVQLIREATNALVRTARAMPEDKAAWSPLDQGRTALNQIAECGQLSRYTVHVLTHREMPPLDMEAYARAVAEQDTLDKAIAFLQSGVDELVAAIEVFPESELGQTVTLPFGPGITKTMDEMMVMTYWNMTYHLGQINYIQTLYGDKQMH